MLKKLFKQLLSRKWLIVPPILIGIGCVAAFALTRKELPRIEIGEQVLTLPVQIVRSSKLKPWAIGYGTAAPSRIWEAVTQVQGRVVDIHDELDSGRRVQKNETLVKIDDADYQSQLAQKNSDLDSLNAKLDELNANLLADQESLILANELLDVANAELIRMQRLKTENAVPQSEVDAARTSVLQQKLSVQNLKNALTLHPSRIASAQASIALATSQVEEAQRNVNRTTIAAPFDGVLSGANLELQQYIGVNQKLFQVQDDRVVEIEAQFSLAQLQKISPNLRLSFDTLSPKRPLGAADIELLSGLTALVTARSGDLTQHWTGKPVRISESVNEQTRTLGIVIQVTNFSQREPAVFEKPRDAKVGDTSDDNPQGRFPSGPILRPGSFCEVTLIGEPIPNSITIPRTALDGNVVYLIDQDNRLQPQAVEIGNAYGENVAITDGLQPGNRIATTFPVPAIKGKLTEPQLTESAPIEAPGMSSIRDEKETQK